MLTKAMLKKQFTLDCDICGATNQSTLNSLHCQNPKCGYLMKPKDDLLTNLFGKAVQVVATPLAELAQRTFATPVLPVPLMAAHIIDESKWNWKWDSLNQIWLPPDYDKTLTTDTIHIIKKASQGTFDDPTWEAGKGLILQRGIGLGGYHYGDVYYDAAASANYLAMQALTMPAASIYGTLEYPQFWLDAENNRGSGSVALTPAQMEQWLYVFVSEFEQTSGQPLGIYTRSIWWNDFVARNPWAHTHALWVARYNAWISEPGEPKDWSNYGKKPILWQWSADGNGRGYEYGMQSNSVDLNRSPLKTTPQIRDLVYGAPAPPPGTLPYELYIEDAATGERMLYRQVSA